VQKAAPLICSVGHIKDMEHNMERTPEDSDREYRIHDEAVVVEFHLYKREKK
jgi:hypothetical protein